MTQSPSKGPIGPSGPDITAELAERVTAAVALAFGLEIAPGQALIREAGAEHEGDYQSNAAMPLAKRLGRPSSEVARELVERLEVGDLCEPPSVAGPGFINLRLRESWLGERLAVLALDPRLGVRASPEGERVVVDYSAPNVAKEMHVGHLRSTIIGDALVRLLSFLGHDVIPQNHLGDWGTPFGMLIEQRLDERRGRAPAGGGDLNGFYRAAREQFDSSPEFAERARRRVVALHGADAETLALWRDLVGESEEHFEEVYEVLEVLLDAEAIAGESSYEAQLSEVVKELGEKGLIVESDGALCVFPPGFSGREGSPLPLIVRKSDGAYNYATTDLAAIRHRVRELGARELLYVVGAPQRLHFEMVFAVAREAGWIGDGIEACHVAFGWVLGSDHKMLRTRTGAPVRLIELLREAIERSSAILVERGVEAGALEGLARSIGIGAVKYADLCVDREKDYVFSFERMLSLEGDTALYLQYANARARSVIRRGGDEGPSPGEPAFRLKEPAERELALDLTRLPTAIGSVLIDYKPHKLCTYLHGLAVSFSGFYESCPILTAEDPGLRASRLALCELTSETLTLGLGLLGIDAPERLSPPPTRPAGA